MAKYEHIYIILGGVEYKDFTLYSNCSTWRRSTPEVAFGCDSTLERKLINITPTVTGQIPKGANIHIVQPCSVAIDDIRKNYTVKRGFDNGDYNVFTPSTYGFDSFTLYTGSSIVYPSHKIIFVNKDVCSRAVMEHFADTHGLELDHNEAIYSKHSPNISMFSPRRASYKHLLDEDIQKPIALISQLDLNSGNEVTADLLRLVYETGKVSWHEKDAEKNYTLQLQILSQHNWRDYEGAISLLIGEMLRTGIARDVRNHQSRYSKAIKPILALRYHKDFKSEKDLKLAQDFVNSILNIGDCRFCTSTDLISKLNDCSITLSTFNEMYNNVIKITPKEYGSTGQS